MHSARCVTRVMTRCARSVARAVHVLVHVLCDLLYKQVHHHMTLTYECVPLQPELRLIFLCCKLVSIVGDSYS